MEEEVARQESRLTQTVTRSLCDDKRREKHIPDWDNLRVYTGTRLSAAQQRT